MQNFEQDFLSYVSTRIICVTYLEFYNSVLCALERAKKTFQGFEPTLFVDVKLVCDPNQVSVSGTEISVLFISKFTYVFLLFRGI